MVRKTKQEALATRNHILDTAEIVFQRRGVSRTSLNEIAQEAGLTRGAIYWHFKDKAGLFNEMVERVMLPLEQTLASLAAHAVGAAREGDPFDPLRANVAAVLRRVVDDPQMRRVFEIVTHKVEYIEELQALRERRLAGRDRCVADIERLLRQAATAKRLTPRLQIRRAAIGVHALLDGLIQNWMLDPAAFDLLGTGRQVIDTYLEGLQRH